VNAHSTESRHGFIKARDGFMATYIVLFTDPLDVEWCEESGLAVVGADSAREAAELACKRQYSWAGQEPRHVRVLRVNCSEQFAVQVTEKRSTEYFVTVAS
jgi:hypothetical protein